MGQVHLSAVQRRVAVLGILSSLLVNPFARGDDAAVEFAKSVETCAAYWSKAGRRNLTVTWNAKAAGLGTLTLNLLVQAGDGNIDVYSGPQEDGYDFAAHFDKSGVMLIDNNTLTISRAPAFRLSDGCTTNAKILAGRVLIALGAVPAMQKYVGASERTDLAVEAEREVFYAVHPDSNFERVFDPKRKDRKGTFLQRTEDKQQTTIDWCDEGGSIFVATAVEAKRELFDQRQKSFHWAQQLRVAVPRPKLSALIERLRKESVIEGTEGAIVYFPQNGASLDLPAVKEQDQMMELIRARVGDIIGAVTVGRGAPDRLKRTQEIRDSRGIRIGAICDDKLNSNRVISLEGQDFCIGLTGFAEKEEINNRVTNGVILFLKQIAAADPPPKQRLLVPAYFYPAGKGAKEWERLLAAPEEAGVVAIVNPASGPGKRVDGNYTKILEQAKKSKVTLVGYVSTNYGKRKTEDVKADVDQWVRFYPGIQGIFFDEQASGTEQLDQLAALYEHVRKTHKLSLVVTNPGTVCDEKYLTKPVSDVACLYEGHEHYDRFTPPAWTKELKPDRIAALAYQVAPAEMPKHLQQAQERRLGWIYITDDQGANPWDQLPSYWDEEVKELVKLNTQKEP